MSRHIGTRPAAANGRPTQTQTYESASEHSDSRHVGTLRLRGEPRQRRGVRWAADVVDNSNMGKKKSKVCCIYHKPREVGESSSESSESSSDSDSDSGQDNSTARMGGRGAARRKGQKKHEHGHEEGCAHDHGHGHNGEETPDSSASDDDAANDRPAHQAARRGRVRRPSPNAYEKMKTYKPTKGGSRTVTETTSGS